MPLPPVNIGLVGLGRAGLFHRERLSLRDDLRVTACFDSDPVRLHAVAADSGCRASEWNELLSDSRIDLVWIATPPATHFELASAALQAGKHVVVETPVTLTVAHASQLPELARKSGRSLIVAHTRRYDDDFRQALSVVQSGSLGDLQSLRLSCWQFNPSSLREPRREQISWRDSPATGGGVLWELGTHILDQLLLLTSDRPTSVYACSTANQDLAEGIVFVVTFSRGAVATLDFSRVALIPRDTGWELNGSLGSYAAGVHYSATREGEVEDVPAAGVAADPDSFYEAVARHLCSSGPNPVSAEQAADVVRLIDSIRQSAETGAVVGL